MRLFGYYAFHTIKNIIRKLLKTWMIVFILVCALFGGVIGFGAAMISDKVSEKVSESSAEISPEEALAEAIGSSSAQDSPAASSGSAESDADSGEELSLSLAFEERSGVSGMQVMELIVGALILVVLAVETLTADKSGSAIFQPADIPILFASPMKPQSVLMFRLMTQLGVMILISFYMIGQLPNLVLNAGLSVAAAFCMLAGWALLLIIGSLLKLVLYMTGESHPAVKKAVWPVLIALAVLLCGGLYLYRVRSGLGILPAAAAFFNAPWTRWIPIWGWLKGFVMFMAEDRVALGLLELALVLASIAISVVLIWRMKVDFYEDAMAKSEETAELQRVARESRTGMAFRKRKKDRSEKYRRDDIRHGAGANVFFFKTMYNRKRFHSMFFTKTAVTYLILGGGAALAARMLAGSDSLLPTAFVLAGVAFYRSLGNPLAEDTRMDFFRLVPESAWAKLFWSLLGGSLSCLLDLLPAFIAAVIILPANPLAALAWMLFIASVDYYSTNVGVFIDLSTPQSAGTILKQLIQIIFLYFGLVPGIAILAVSFVMGSLSAGAVIAAVVHVAIGSIFFALSPLFL